MNFRIPVVVLLAVFTATSAFGARPNERTVAPFDPSPNVLPTKWPKVWVQNTPRADGSFYDGGAGQYTKAFYVQLFPWLRSWATARVGLDNETSAFQEFVNDRGAVLQKSITGVASDKLSKFNMDVGGQLKTELNAYVNARAKEVTASKAVEVAMTRTQASLKAVEQNEELITAQKKADEKATLAAKVGEIKKQIAASKAVGEIFTKAVGTAFDLVSIVQDPVGNAGKAIGMVTGAVINAVVDEHETELMVLDLQMKALDEAIATHKQGAQAAALEKARLEYKAGSLEVVQRMLEEQQVVVLQKQALDNLADLEKGAKLKRNANATDVFYDLRLNHQEFVLAAMDLRHKLTSYQIVVDRGPGRQATIVTPELTKTIDQVAAFPAPDAQWLGIARASRDYMDRYGSWYGKERTFVAGQAKALGDRVEVLPIDAAVSQIIARF